VSKARKNSTAVSLTRDELEKLDSLYRLAWGSYSPDKTQQKLAKALARIDAQVERTKRLKSGLVSRS
jgi:hypothetical protein